MPMLFKNVCYGKLVMSKLLLGNLFEQWLEKDNLRPNRQGGRLKWVCAEPRVEIKLSKLEK